MEGENHNDPLFPIAVLIDELKVQEQNILIWRLFTDFTVNTA